MYSAVKVNGRKLYEYARKGIEVERPMRKVTIHALELLDTDNEYEGTDVTFKIRVGGKGTYIRTLAVQIGELLGYPAHMASLVRTASGTYQIDDCHTLSELEVLKEKGLLDTSIRPLEDALIEFPYLEVEDEDYDKVIHGQVLPKNPILDSGYPIVFMKNNKALAVYKIHPTKPELMKPEKMFPLNS